MNEAAVRAVLRAHFERGEPSEYVQLKDVALVLEAEHPSCHQRLCCKAGTRVPNNEALAVVVSHVTGLQVRNAQVTMTGQVKVRGPIRGFRKVRCASCPLPWHSGPMAHGLVERNLERDCGGWGAVRCDGGGGGWGASIRASRALAPIPYGVPMPNLHAQHFTPVTNCSPCPCPPLQITQPAETDERAIKAPRLDPASEVEALRERVRALQLENERLKEVAATAELRAGAAELRAVAAEARAAEAGAAGACAAEAANATPMAEPPRAACEPLMGSLVQTARPACPSPLASTASSGDGGDGGESDAGGNVVRPAPHTLQLAQGLVQQAVRFQRTGIEARVDSYDAVDGLHTVSANGRTWREALVGRNAVGFVRLAPDGAIQSAEPSSEPNSLVAYSSLVASLQAGLLALGRWDAFPMAGEGEVWRSMPLGMDLGQWTQVLNAGMRPGGLAILLVTGTLVPVRLHTAVLHLIADRLPGSCVIALNVGELEADTDAYDALTRAVAQPSCVLGHLYFRDPVSEAEHERKRRVRAQLRLNRAKPGYLVQLARDEVWALKGAHCWHNFSDALRARALAWAAAALPPPPRRTLRAPCPVRSGVTRVGLGRAHQAEVPAWPHGDSPTAPLAAATASLERGDARVALHDADMLRGQRAAFNARLLAADPRRRWRDAGAQRFALGPTCARNLLAYVRDPANRDERGRLRLQDGKCTVLGGYGNYQATHAVEAGARHSNPEQAKHTLLLSHEVLDLARVRLPGLNALVLGGLHQLPEAEADGHTLVPLHGHILDQGSGTARFADHQDTEEELAAGARTPDRRVLYTVVIALSDGGNTAMRILGQDELIFTGEAGSGAVFRSALWHRTERAGTGVWKLALFYGYLL